MSNVIERFSPQSVVVSSHAEKRATPGSGPLDEAFTFDFKVGYLNYLQF